jgi:MFS family permease
MRSRERVAPNGMRTFTAIWAGQIISIIGSGLTEFALGVWIYQQTGSATQFALTILCIALPPIMLSPLAGAIVDRYDRRLVMLIADSGAAVSTLVLGLLYWLGWLQVWHVYLGVLVSSSFSTFQGPAYSAMISVLVPRRHLGRANGMVELGWAAGQVAAPVLAAGLMATVSLAGVLFVDVATFLVAVSVLLTVRAPRLETAGAAEGEEGLRSSLTFGWRYLAAQPGLRGLLIFFLIVNFSVGLYLTLFTPLVLSFGSAAELATILSIGSLGLVAGSVLMIAWGGPKRRVLGIVGLGPVFGLAMVLMGVQPSVPLLAAVTLVFFFCQPIINSCDEALWQSKVPAAVQGRVFSARRMIERSSALLAYLIVGPLSEYVFDPLLVAHGPLAGTVGQVIGVGPGRGIGLLFILVGAVPTLAAVWAYANRRIRLIEQELPDAEVDADPIEVAAPPDEIPARPAEVNGSVAEEAVTLQWILPQAQSQPVVQPQPTASPKPVARQ